MRLALRFIVLPWATLSLIASQAVAEPAGSLQRALTNDDVVRDWESFDTARLTPDGKWFVYGVRPCALCAVAAGDFNVVVRNTGSDVERRYRAGDIRSGAGRLAMSPTGRWLAWVQAEAAGTPGSPTGRAVKVVEIASGRATEIPDSCSFSFSPSGGNSPGDEWIAAQSCPPQRSTRSETPSGIRLALRRLGNDRVTTLNGVSTFSFGPKGTNLAYAGAEGLMLLDLASGRQRMVDASSGAGVSYQKPTWSKSGNGLAILRTTRNAKPAAADEPVVAPNASIELLVFTGLESGSERKTVLAPSLQAGFPEGYEISTDGIVPPSSARDALVWRDDERGVFFGIRPAQTAAGKPDVQENGVVVWHWRDVVLPAGRAANAPRDARFSYLSFLSLPEGRFVKLADASMREVQVHSRSRYLLGFDTRAYDREQNVTGRRTRDYYRVELLTGSRDLIIPKLALPIIGSDPVQSPDGTFVVYPEKGQYVAFDLVTGSRRNLTSALPVSFSDARNVEIAINKRDVSVPAIQGWTAGETHVLISDSFDVWALPLKGGGVRNLTVHGRRAGIRYSRTDFGGDRHENERIELDRPIYFRTQDQKTGQTGVARHVSTTGTMESLYSADADLRYEKAAHADVYVCEKQTAVESPQYYLVNEWRPDKPLTHLNAQQAHYSWSPGAKLLSYRNGRGDELQAALHLPAGYVEGKKYPTIVSIYEFQSQSLHQYRYPQSAGAVVVTSDVPRWTQSGYAILEPDIQAYVRDPGPAALEAVTGAVNAAVESGVVDADRMALEGHSYGGYETLFVVTHTNLFKAAVTSAAMSNLLSAYGQVYAPELVGVPASGGMETNQPFLGGPWWGHWNAFVDNSPLFSAPQLQTPLLLVHGDRDGRVPFAQSVELFNTLRRYGDKPVVLLQYQGDGHTLAIAKNLRDLTTRKMQFFDHFLKEKPAPDWWLAATPPPSSPRTSAGSSF